MINTKATAMTSEEKRNVKDSLQLQGDKTDIDLIVLSGMFPRKYSPYSGTFVYEQVKALRRFIKGRIIVIVPVPWSPKLLWFRKKWREYGETIKEEVRKEISVYYPRYFAIPGKYFFPLQGFFMYLSARSTIKQFVKANGNNRTILHAHAILPAGLAAIFLKKEFAINTVITAHGSDINIYPFITRLTYLMTKLVLQNSDRLVAVSEKLKEKIQNITLRSDIKVVTNGVNLEKFADGENHNYNCSKQTDSCTILFVGTVCFEKGIRELFQAFKLLKKEHDNLHLTLVGKNIIQQWIEAFIEKNQLHDFIELAGMVDHDFIKKYYSHASIFVLPSYSEGMPTVMFEAMANSLPIIISRVGGVEEVIRDHINGLLIDPHNHNDLCEKLKLLIENEDLRHTLGDNAFCDVKKYTWKHNAINMNMIYNEILPKY
jgi:glycosyltransferase involved in cell wall biosynthesis